MSRMYNERVMPVRCVDCEGFCPADCCITGNHAIEDPMKWRFCYLYKQRGDSSAGRASKMGDEASAGTAQYSPPRTSDGRGFESRSPHQCK